MNNNAYTNLMARENLRYAAETVQSLQVKTPDAYNALVHKTALGPSEVEEWIRAAESMYIPYNEKLKIIPQDDSFLDREPWDFHNTPRDHYPLLLFYHPLDIYRLRWHNLRPTRVSPSPTAAAPAAKARPVANAVPK